METKYVEKLAKVFLIAIYLTIAIFALKYFGNVVGYILLSFVVSLLAKPLVRLLRKIKIRGKSLPDGLLAIISIIVILAVLVGVISGLIPVFAKVIRNITTISELSSLEGLSVYLNDLNVWLRETFSLEPNFKLEVSVMDKISTILSFKLFGSMIGTVANTLGSIGVGLFSVVFISFFLIKDETLFLRLLSAVTPDKHTEHVSSTLADVEILLSRYFVGLIIEMSVVGLIDFLGLWAITGLDFDMALGIGFMAGILNIIPYIGPLIGGVLGGVMAIALKITSTGFVIDAHLGVFVALVAAVFIAAQLVDNIVLQPLIYSTSVHAHPLEIFIVLLLAGSIGGIIGMLLAIPAYTVVRVICIHFLSDTKFVKSLFTDKSHTQG